MGNYYSEAMNILLQPSFDYEKLEDLGKNSGKMGASVVRSFCAKQSSYGGKDMHNTRSFYSGQDVFSAKTSDSEKNSADDLSSQSNVNVSIKVEDKIIESPKPYHRGYYFGSFDMFHVGHLRSIQYASNLCDQLIVGVTSDDAYQRYNPHAPIIPLEQRMEIISAIKGVTLVVPQENIYDNCAPAIALGCDVLFTSDEYKKENLENENLSEKQRGGIERNMITEQKANENGLDMVYIPRTQGISTSDIKSKIIEQQPPTEMIYSEGEMVL